MRIKVCPALDLPNNQSCKFTIPGEKFDREGFVIRHQNTFRAYYNECPHVGLPLDWGDNDFFAADFGQLKCKNHGAEFLPDSGACVAGPCTGAWLKPIVVVEEGETVHACLDER